MRNFLTVLAILGAIPAAAQTSQPYAGQQDRAIANMSKQRITGLRAGRGLGYAKAAELNGFPGPMHVLELGDALGLDAETRLKIEAIRAAMLAKAVPLGEELIAAEAALDRLFKDRAPDPEAVLAATRRIGLIEAELRAAHLVAHLEATPLLTKHQRVIYARERGYGQNHGHGIDQSGSAHSHD